MPRSCGQGLHWETIILVRNATSHLTSFFLCSTEWAASPARMTAILLLECRDSSVFLTLAPAHVKQCFNHATGPCQCRRVQRCSVEAFYDCSRCPFLRALPFQGQKCSPVLVPAHHRPCLWPGLRMAQLLRAHQFKCLQGLLLIASPPLAIPGIAPSCEPQRRSYLRIP
jgi:hypothetical protein